MLELAIGFQLSSACKKGTSLTLYMSNVSFSLDSQHHASRPQPATQTLPAAHFLLPAIHVCPHLGPWYSLFLLLSLPWHTERVMWVISRVISTVLDC